MEHAVNQRAAVLLSDIFHLGPHPYDIAFPMLLAEFYLGNSTGTDHLHSLIHDLLSILFVSQSGGILFDQLLVFFHRIPRKLRHSI